MLVLPQFGLAVQKVVHLQPPPESDHTSPLPAYFLPTHPSLNALSKQVIPDM